MGHFSNLIPHLEFFGKYKQGLKANEGGFEFKIWWIKKISLGANWEKMH